MSGNQILGQFNAIIASRNEEIERLEKELLLLDARYIKASGMQRMGLQIRAKDKRIGVLRRRLAKKQEGARDA
jgi:hypothetical protein